MFEMFCRNRPPGLHNHVRTLILLSIRGTDLQVANSLHWLSDYQEVKNWNQNKIDKHWSHLFFLCRWNISSKQFMVDIWGRDLAGNRTLITPGTNMTGLSPRFVRSQPSWQNTIYNWRISQMVKLLMHLQILCRTIILLFCKDWLKKNTTILS